MTVLFPKDLTMFWTRIAGAGSVAKVYLKIVVDQLPQGSGRLFRLRQILEWTPSQPLLNVVSDPVFVTEDVEEVSELHRPRSSSVSRLNTTAPAWYTGLPNVDLSEPDTLAPLTSHAVVPKVPEPSLDETLTP